MATQNDDSTNFIKKETKQDNGTYVIEINKEALKSTSKTKEGRLEEAIDLFMKTSSNQNSNIGNGNNRH